MPKVPKGINPSGKVFKFVEMSSVAELIGEIRQFLMKNMDVMDVAARMAVHGASQFVS